MTFSSVYAKAKRFCKTALITLLEGWREWIHLQEKVISLLGLTKLITKWRLGTSDNAVVKAVEKAVSKRNDLQIDFAQEVIYEWPASTQEWKSRLEDYRHRVEKINESALMDITAGMEGQPSTIEQEVAATVKEAVATMFNQSRATS